MFPQTRSRTSLASAASVKSRTSLSALDVIKIMFVNNKRDFTNFLNFFHPERAHQIFGDNEEIRGYRFLEILFYYNAATLELLVRIWSSNNPNTGDRPYDGIFQRLERWIPDDYTTDLIPFCRRVRSTRCQLPLGTRISPIDRENHLVIYHNRGSDQQYAKLHRRMESLLVFFIDGVNKLNLLDPLWDFYILYKIQTENHKKLYIPIGYCTVRKVYAPQDKIRHRISQFIIFPPYQRRGYGIIFINKLQTYLRGKRETLDITVESPAPRFQTLRDLVDVRDCMQQKQFKIAIRDERLEQKAITNLRHRLKLSVTQIERIFEIVCLWRSQKNIIYTEEYIRREIAERLTIPVPKAPKQAQLTFLEQTEFHDMKWSREVENTVDVVIAHYRAVIRRLSKVYTAN